MDLIKWIGIAYFVYSCAVNVCQSRGFRESKSRTTKKGNDTDMEPIYMGETGTVIFGGITLIIIIIVVCVLYKKGKLPCSKKKEPVNQGRAINPMAPVAPTMAGCPGMMHAPPPGYHAGFPAGPPGAPPSGMHYRPGGAQLPGQVSYTGHK